MDHFSSSIHDDVDVRHWPYQKRDSECTDYGLELRRELDQCDCEGVDEEYKDHEAEHQEDETRYWTEYIPDG